jgi:sigma-E factor negative regulatory protein RseA
MKENLSAWMDSELPGAQSGQLLPQLKSNAGLRGSWDSYHLIGDTLRGAHGPDLCAKICARLEAEPTVLAPRRRDMADKSQRFALSAVAIAAAVAFVSWVAFPGMQEGAPQSASAPPAVPEVKQAAAPAAAGIKDYLLAHQRYSPSSAMQGVAPYVRTVAEERSAARR